MALFCGSLLRSGSLSLFPSHLTRNLKVFRYEKFSSSSSSSSSLCSLVTKTNHRTTTRTGPHVSLRTNGGRKTCLWIGPRPELLPCGGPVPTQSPQDFHTSAPLKALPMPLIWLILKPLQKLAAIILGRSIRKWWVALPDNRRQLMRDWTWQRRWHLASGAGVAMVIVALLLLTHLDECPVTGRTRLLVFSKENYMELAAMTSDMYMEEFAELLLPVTDPRHQVVERVVQHLAQRNKDIPEVAEVTWSVHVVQSDITNAFVLSNGKVFMYTGMLEAVADVHQLTVVLGHEMAHAVLAHSAEKGSLSHVVDLLSVILLTAIWAVCPKDSLALVGQWAQEKLKELMFDCPYSRKLESEADQVGLQLAAKACADVRAGPVFWQQMEIREQLTGESNLPEWLSTHPSHRNRITQLDRLIPQALELRERCMCPALPDTDPRSVFSKSVKVLLENSKHQGKGAPERTRKPHPTGIPTSLPMAAPAALLARSATPCHLNMDELGKVAQVTPLVDTSGGGKGAQTSSQQI